MLRTVKVELLVLSLPDGGERVVPSLPYLNRSLRTACSQLDETESEIEDSEIQAEKDALSQNLKFLKRSIRRYKALIEQQPAIAAKCKKVSYEINIPTYDDLITFESAARTGEDDMPRIDPQKLMDAVLPTLFAGDVPQDPQHVRRCWERWKEEAYPDDSALPFLD